MRFHIVGRRLQHPTGTKEPQRLRLSTGCGKLCGIERLRVLKKTLTGAVCRSSGKI